MSHLSRDEWLALVESDEDPRSPHLAACERCREDVATGRALLAGLGRVDVPEPSPLFWDHFSARVAASLDAQPAPLVRRGTRWRILVPLAVGVAALVMAVALDRGRPAPSGAPIQPAAVASDASPEQLGDDEHWQVLSSMAGDFDVETLSDSLGRSGETGSESAVWQLNEQERAELTRLLRAELQPGDSGS
jgi:hypothetical protein